jgi:hypothetical protein
MMPQQGGLEAQAMIEVNMAVRGLINALGKYKRIDTDLGKSIVDALKILGKVTPEISESVGQSEVAALMSQAQAVTPNNPMAKPQQTQPTMLGTGRPAPMPMR